MAASPYNLKRTVAQWQRAYPNDPKNWSPAQYAFAHPSGGKWQLDGDGNIVPPPGMSPSEIEAVANAAAFPTDHPITYDTQNGTLTPQQNARLAAAQSPQGATPAGGDFGIGNIPPRPSGGSSKSRAVDNSRSPDAPIGLPVTSTQVLNPDGSSSQQYSTNYIPPMWIKGQGPRARTADRPFDPNPTDSGSDLPHKIVHSDGTVTYDWYRNRDIYGPATQSPDQIQSIQEKMVAAGILDPASVHWGLWGTTDQQAYAQILGQANMHGVDAWSMLGYMAEHPNMPQVKLDSPMTAQVALDSAVQSLLGRKANPDEEQRFIDAWNAQQNQAETQPPTSGPVTQLPSVTDFAKTYVDQQYGGEEQGQGMLHGIDLIHGLINSTQNAGG